MLRKQASVFYIPFRLDHSHTRVMLLTSAFAQNGLPKNQSLDPCYDLPKNFEINECTLNPEFWAPVHVCESDACLATNTKFGSRCKNDAI